MQLFQLHGEIGYGKFGSNPLPNGLFAFLLLFFKFRIVNTYVLTVIGGNCEIDGRAMYLHAITHLVSCMSYLLKLIHIKLKTGVERIQL